MYRRVTGCFALSCWLAVAAGARDFHAIQVIDSETRRGVPLVELCTTSNACFFTDSNGLVFLNEPSYWNQKVFFRIRSHGYEHAPDFFGTPGRAFTITRGGTTTVELKRVNIAERLYRVTGEGIYRDSVLLGRKTPVAEPLLNHGVMGLDTVMHAVYRGRLFWLFGDTDRVSASLGNFATTCALSKVPGLGGLDPERGIDLDYFGGREGFVKAMAAIPGPGMKWMFALMVVRDQAGRERLVARYDRMKSLEETYDMGLAVFDDDAREFRPLVSFGTKAALAPYGRATRVSVDGVEYFYFSSPRATPVVRVRADWDSVQTLSEYEGYACTEQSCTWKKGAEPASVSFIDVETGKRFEATAGSVQWNEFRKRWIAILQKNVGDVWYAEADTPVGPWAYARRVVQHDQYTFYWPGQIAEFDKNGGRRIYFMGTYTHTFSGNPVKTPRYDYNQIMYALDLTDGRLELPVAYYVVHGLADALPKEDVDRLKAWKAVKRVAYYAYPNRQAVEARLPNPDPRPMFDLLARQP